MENQNIQSLGVSQCVEKQIVDEDDPECKFKRIEDDDGFFEDCDIAQALVTYHDTIEKCECMNDNIFQVQKLNTLPQMIQSPPLIKNQDLQQPSKPIVKFKISIEKKPKVTKIQNSQKSIVLQKENPSNPSEVWINIHRVSIDSSDQVKQNFSVNDQKEFITRSQHYSATQSSQYVFLSNKFNEEKLTSNSNLSNNLRMKSSSIFSLSSQNGGQQKKFKQCIPLRQYHVKQKESFLQTAYRMRRLQQPNWTSYDKLQKSNTKMTMKPKEKMVFETYDFDGELIPSFYALQKQRKFAGEIPKVEFQFANDIPVENKRKNIERKQTKPKTIKQTKSFQYPELIPVESQFLKNFKDLRWSQNIERADTQQNENKKRLFQFGNMQGKRKLHQEEWISDFQKIKNSGSQKNSMPSHFQHSFSKYLKAKTIHEKQNKQKTHSLQVGKHLAMLLQKQNEKRPSIHQPIRVLKKGPQKIRANKTLFKTILGTSLKNLDPQCREDIATIKSIKSPQKQNIEASDGQKNKKLKSTRNSDTILFKDEFQLTQIVGQAAGDSKTDFSKSLNESQQLIKKGSTKQMSNKILSQGTFSNSTFGKNYLRNETDNLLQSKYENKDLQKMFKKETKKVIFKHSFHGGNRQSFQ